MEKIIEITFIVRFRYSEENTRKTWMTDFIIVCQNLIGLFTNFKANFLSFLALICFGFFYLETIGVC